MPAGLVNVQCLQDTLVSAGADEDPAAVFEFALVFPSIITQKAVRVRKNECIKIDVYYLLL